MKGIVRSVGVNGINQRKDVRIIQTYLNSFSAWKKKIMPLKVDGIAGNKTYHAIKAFQQQAVGMKNPDGRIDPHGKTFRYLTMYISQEQQQALETAAHQNQRAARPVLISSKTVSDQTGLNGFTVSYKSGVLKSRRIVSNYAMSVIKIALKESGMKTAVITSTLRTPEEQASIMLKNAKIDLKKQYRLYGRGGDAVLKIYDKNKDKSDTEILQLMVDKINDLEKSNRRVSNHCISKNGYVKKNIIDIGLNSTKNANKKFNPKKFTKALKSLEKEGFINRLIDETGKSNQCWHIEVTPNKKILSNYNKGSILNQTTFVNGAPK